VKVYHVISSFYPLIGGAERATQTLCQGLVAKGLSLEVLTTWYPGLTRHQLIENVSVRRMGLGGVGKLRSLMFGLHTLLYILLYGRSVALVHVQNIDTPLLVGMLLKLLMRKPLVVTINSDQVIPGKQRTLPGRFRLYFMRKLVDQFTTISKSGQEGLLRAGIPQEQISLIPNGLDTNYFRPPTSEEKSTLRARYAYGPEDVIILFLGRLISTKRADLLLEALSDLEQDTPVKCIIVGDGPEKNSLQDLTNKLGLEGKVRFVGATDDVRDFYWLSDIFVQPSQFEGLSVALLESMACGMAVLVSQCAGNLDAVNEGENGLTFAVDDAHQLSERLKTLIENPENWRVLGKKARTSVQETYAISAVVKAHLEIYQRLLRYPAQKTHTSVQG